MLSESDRRMQIQGKNRGILCDHGRNRVLSHPDLERGYQFWNRVYGLWLQINIYSGHGRAEKLGPICNVVRPISIPACVTCVISHGEVNIRLLLLRWYFRFRYTGRLKRLLAAKNAHTFYYFQYTPIRV